MSFQAIHKAPGVSVDYTPVAAVSAGAVVEVGSVPLVATQDIAAGALGALLTVGVFAVVKKEAAFTAGDPVYWDNNGNPYNGVALSGCASPTASEGNLMGLCLADAGSTDETVSVLLTAAKRTATIAGSVTADDITGSDSSLGIAGQAAAQGGAIALVGGTSSTSGNAGGAITLTGGTPGATGVGGAVTVSGGAGGATSGAGGAAVLQGGDGTAGNANGGACAVRGGNAHGSGTDGVLSVGVTNTSAINIGAASIPTAITGPLVRGIGASTAAAGSAAGDAAALPAGTASIYPTTAADDTKGVILHANDQVTGRDLFIGNGVSNKILKVYPPTGGTINGAAANAAFSSASGKGVRIICLDGAGNTWLAA